MNLLPTSRAGTRIVTLVGIALGLLLTMFVLADLLRPPFQPVNLGSEAESHDVPMIVSALHGLINALIVAPPLAGALLARSDLRRAGWYPLLTAAVVVMALISVLANPDPKALVYAGLLALTFAAGILLVSLDGGRDAGMAAFMATTSLGCTLVLAIAIGMHEYAWGRLASRAGPTYWGMIAIIAFTLSFALSRLWLRAIVIAIAAAVLVLTSARGGMVAVALSAMVVAVLTVATAPPNRRGFYLVAALIGLAALPFAGVWAADHLLELSDPLRGLNSGATGRSFAWAEAWHLFATHPLTGVGYRQHEQYITVATSAHNGYLAVMAEMGVVGICLYLLLVVGATVRSLLAIRDDRSLVAMTTAAFMVAYCSIGFTENIALGTGLAMPLAMMIVAARGWSQPTRG